MSASSAANLPLCKCSLSYLTRRTECIAHILIKIFSLTVNTTSNIPQRRKNIFPKLTFTTNQCYRTSPPMPPPHREVIRRMTKRKKQQNSTRHQHGLWTTAPTTWICGQTLSFRQTLSTWTKPRPFNANKVVATAINDAKPVREERIVDSPSRRKIGTWRRVATSQLNY